MDRPSNYYLYNQPTSRTLPRKPRLDWFLRLLHSSSGKSGWVTECKWASSQEENQTCFLCSYEYSFTHNRLWRKNRRKNGGLSSLLLNLCDGVDLNRNFGYHWADTSSFSIHGGSSLSCAETYSGIAPFSEPESRNIADFVASIQQNVVVSSADLWTFYGHSFEFHFHFSLCESFKNKVFAKIQAWNWCFYQHFSFTPASC